MASLSETERLDRHALVLAIWMTFGFVAVALFSYGLGAGGALFVLLAFAALLAALVGHIIVNAVYRTTFSAAELALGLVVYAVGLVVFAVAALVPSGLDERHVLPIGLGLLAVFVAAIFYMITHFGVRQVFEAFDVVRDFGAGSERSEAGQQGEQR